ncbi:hypothetical protein SeMB42_g07503 [Synchytrium endobioticum]|uniref:V-type proton ATPase subunit C n=1 Tax=Synchytrium endobioticum TaxID=286115 RepID=A0A507C0S0_9FUNG|nr:hypothetical protein SeMB42_g07503 [Synchytrium endobioticum]TPX39003.1 hypothetical protein SeLEV6574_g07464 [Synchytrium endobioticum]
MSSSSSASASVYWLVSIPADPTKLDAVNKLRDRIASPPKADYADICPFSLPEFKIGTLDALMVLSDDLTKTDGQFETIAIKISDNLKTLLGGDVEEWRNNLQVGDKSLHQYLHGFQWNTMKYRTDKSLRELADTIIQEVAQVDELMKKKMQAYSQVKTALQTLQRKETGNLATRNIAGIVNKDNFVLDSEYLTTLLVAVPKNAEREWLGKYESICQMVVPRSSTKLAEDDEYCLYSVTLFQRVVEEFTRNAREQKFMVRDFKWNDHDILLSKKELVELIAAEKEQWTTLVRLCKTNFGEIYASWTHIKVLRVYVESVLRYGLPPDFQAMVIRIKPKMERKVKDIMNQYYARLTLGAGQAKAGKGILDEPVEENLQMLMGEKEFTPFVMFAARIIGGDL